ncbi:hypothetical protein MBLNU457_6993t1 [Dothideomycetes sp. NU457]
MAREGSPRWFRRLTSTPVANGQTIDDDTITTEPTDTTSPNTTPQKLQKPPTKRNSILKPRLKSSPSNAKQDSRKDSSLDISPKPQSQRLSLLSTQDSDYNGSRSSESAIRDCSFDEEDFEPETSPTKDDAMSAAIKSVAKKTSLRTLNLLCDSSCATKPSETSDIDVQATIALLQELRKKATPEELVALHRALLPTKSNDQPEEPVALSPYSRRSSVVTPGKATRSKSPLKTKASREQVDTPKKQRPLSEQISSTSSWTPFKKSNKHQSLVVDAPASENASESVLARSYTPADLDIDSIGTHKLGTLRVMNGTISPDPSLHDLNAPLKSERAPSRSIDEHVRTGGAQVNTPSKLSQVSSPNLGLDAYDSDEDTPTPTSPAVPGSAPSQAEQSGAAGRSPTQALNMSVGSYSSRLSTIHDEGSPVEELEDPDFALRRLNGIDEQTPPSSSGTDSLGITVEQPKTSSLGPIRPAPPVKADSGYGSERADRHPALYSSDDEPFESAQNHVQDQISLQTPSRRPRHILQQAIEGDRMMSGLPRLKTNQAQPAASVTESPARAVNKQPSMSPAQRGSPATVAANTPLPMSPLQSHPPHDQNTHKKRLQKSAPNQRKSSNNSVHEHMVSSVESLPSVPDDMNINFSRRIARSPGAFHPEHAYAAHAIPSKESLDEMNATPDTPERQVGGSTATPTSASSFMSKFRLRGRSRSKSMSRPEVSLPRDDEIPTVAETVPQYAEIVAGTEEQPSQTQERETSRPREDSRPREEGRPGMGRKRTSSLPRYYAKPESEREVEQVQSPRVGMDEETARLLARRKSRDYVSAADREARRQRSQSRPRKRADEDRSRNKTAQDDAADQKRTTSAHGSRIPVKSESADLSQTETPTRPPMASRQRSKSLSSRSERFVDTEDRSQPPVPKLPGAGPQAETLSHEAAHPGWPGWEKQASLWKERRRTINESVIRQNSDNNVQSLHPDSAAPVSPAVIVSRYVTPPNLNLAGAGSPQANDSRTRSARSDTFYRAFEHADARPAKADIPRTQSASSASTRESNNLIDPRPAKADVPRTDSAISNASYRTAASSASSQGSTPLKTMSANVRSPTVTEPESPYRAYRATHAVEMAKIVSPDRTPRSLVPPTQPHSNTSSVYSSREPTPSPDSLVDRYGGGLDYGWERGMGFHGSAGTRSKSSERAHRKSVVLSESFGVDLSDVPVFMTKVNEARARM